MPIPGVIYRFPPLHLNYFRLRLEAKSGVVLPTVPLIGFELLVPRRDPW